MKDIYEKRAWHNSDVNKLESSSIHSYLNNTFLNLFDSNVRNAIKQVKIPYHKNGGSGGTDQNGINGLSTKIFLLSGYEVGIGSANNVPQDGTKLDYFITSSSDTSKCIANFNGSATFWWLRSPSTSDTNYVWFIYPTGGYGYDPASSSYGIRPALILPSTYKLNLPYDLTVETPSKIKTGDILNCPYSGSAKSITLPKGQYKLECWGAQGGSYSTYNGGAGGYSVGTLTLTDDNTTLYIYVGGQPTSTSSTSAAIPGGFNGGGSARVHSYGNVTTYCQAGGGGTDIRLGKDSLYARIIVAGGGGGSASIDAKSTKYGGGTSGGSPVAGYAGAQTGGGTQGNKGTFGVGGNGYTAGYNYQYASGGGGGGWYGGSGYSQQADGSSVFRDYNGGGSGYVYTASTASNYPSGCLLNSSYYLTNASTIAGNTAFTSPTGSSETGHTGNGYIRIIVIETNSGNTFIKTDSTTWKNYKNIFIKTPTMTILPNGYTQLEYIKSNGTQYINTGFKPTSNTRVVMNVEPLEVPSILAFFGTRDSSTPTASLSYNAWATNTTHIRSDYFGSSILSNETNILTKGTIDKNKNILTGYGQTITNTTSTGKECSYNLFLLACNDMGTAKYYLKSILYSCKIYDNDTLIRDFVPVKRISDNEYGLWDKVTKTFYPNAGTGIFTAGPSVTLTGWHKIKDIQVKIDNTTWKQVL